MNENYKPQVQARHSKYASSRKEQTMNTALKTLLAIATISALLTSAFAQNSYHAPTLKDYAIASGVDWPEPVILTDLPQFSDATIGNLAELVTLVADRYYHGDVVTACERLAYSFESRAQMNRVIAVLTGS